MRMHEIRELIKLVDRSSITDFEYENEGFKVSLKKNSVNAVGAHNETSAVSGPEKSSSAETAPATVSQKPEQPVKEQVHKQTQIPETPRAGVEDDQLHKIESPMVGTFYRAPAPDAEPYVQAGDKVTETTVVCIVEAMKLMNEIEAEVRGEIVEVLVENGQLVEYGQPLFLVKPE